MHFHQKLLSILCTLKVNVFSFQFLKMQGKKQRGKEEIHIVDVKADDFISAVDLQKTLTEETQEYAAHRKKDGPTSLQKRKHQITYLAHQVTYECNRRLKTSPEVFPHTPVLLQICISRLTLLQPCIVRLN